MTGYILEILMGLQLFVLCLIYLKLENIGTTLVVSGENIAQIDDHVIEMKSDILDMNLVVTEGNSKSQL